MTSDDVCDVTAASSACLDGLCCVTAVRQLGVTAAIGSLGLSFPPAASSVLAVWRRSARFSVLVTAASADDDFRSAGVTSSDDDDVSRPLLTDRDTVSEGGVTPGVG